jgi:hypothetical protein
MNSSGIVANGIGQPVRRKEDFRLVTGQGSFGLIGRGRARGRIDR